MSPQEEGCHPHRQPRSPSPPPPTPRLSWAEVASRPCLVRAPDLAWWACGRFWGVKRGRQSWWVTKLPLTSQNPTGPSCVLVNATSVPEKRCLSVLHWSA